MIDVLIVAYHYPPIVSGGTERAVSLVEHLPERGFLPHILTTDAFGVEDAGSVYRVSEPVGWYRRLFNRTASQLPEAARSRTRTESPLSPFAALARRFTLPDAQVGWLPGAYRAARRLMTTFPIRLVVTTGPPFSSFLLGAALKQTTHVPWLADFRDSWIYDPLDDGLRGRGLRPAVEAALERYVLRHAHWVTCTTDVSGSYLRRLRRDRVTVVPNGFTRGELSKVETGSDRPFRFVHTGSFSASHPDRSPRLLVEAAERIDESFEIVFVGALSEPEKNVIQPLVDAGRATVTGPVSRAEAARWQNEADVLVVVDHPRDVLASNIPGKVYEYGARGKPLLAIAPRGATSQLVEQSGGGVCTGHDVEAVERAMRSLLQGTADIQPDPEWWAPFERERAADLMADLFRGLLGLDRAG
ncbi:MAG: hypothetical protein CME19_00750 [Gemmatimonadetes bacterium]|nr:hypothetical protein [Gemmatimonadota bacterium]